jgi:glycine cleavage system regulatory protein
MMRGGDIVHGDELAGGAVTGESFHILEESLDSFFAQPIRELESHCDHLVLTASGVDKIGWTAKLSRTIADAGGNVTHSRMVRLGNDFIIQMHVSVEPSQRMDLLKQLRRNRELTGLNIHCNTLSRRNTGTYDAATFGVTVRCVGADRYVDLQIDFSLSYSSSQVVFHVPCRPGMLASISEKMYANGLSLENVTTDVRVGRKTNVKEFVVEADSSTTRFMDQDGLRDMVANLNELKTDLDLDHLDIRVRRYDPTTSSITRRGSFR